MTGEFENVVCTIEESRNLTEMTIEDLTSSLDVHEQRREKRDARRSVASKGDVERRQIVQW